MSAMLSCLFLEALWSPAGKGLASWLFVCDAFLCFCHFPIWCPGSGVVSVCISIPELCMIIFSMKLSNVDKNFRSRRNCFVLKLYSSGLGDNFINI